MTSRTSYREDTPSLEDTSSENNSDESLPNLTRVVESEESTDLTAYRHSSDERLHSLSPTLNNYVWIATSDVLFQIREKMEDFIVHLRDVELNTFDNIQGSADEKPVLPDIFSSSDLHSSDHAIASDPSTSKRPSKAASSSDRPGKLALKQAFGIVRNLLQKIFDVIGRISDKMEPKNVDEMLASDPDARSDLENNNYAQYVFQIVYYLLDIVSEQTEDFVKLLSLAHLAITTGEIPKSLPSSQISQIYHPRTNSSIFDDHLVFDENQIGMSPVDNSEFKTCAAEAMRTLISIYDQVFEFLVDYLPEAAEGETPTLPFQRFMESTPSGSGSRKRLSGPRSRSRFSRSRSRSPSDASQKSEPCDEAIKVKDPSTSKMSEPELGSPKESAAIPQTAPLPPKEIAPTLGSEDILGDQHSKLRAKSVDENKDAAPLEKKTKEVGIDSKIKIAKDVDVKAKDSGGLSRKSTSDISKNKDAVSQDGQKDGVSSPQEYLRDKIPSLDKFDKVPETDAEDKCDSQPVFDMEDNVSKPKDNSSRLQDQTGKDTADEFSHSFLSSPRKPWPEARGHHVFDTEDTLYGSDYRTRSGTSSESATSCETSSASSHSISSSSSKHDSRFFSTEEATHAKDRERTLREYAPNRSRLESDVSVELLERKNVKMSTSTFTPESSELEAKKGDPVHGKSPVGVKSEDIGSTSDKKNMNKPISNLKRDIVTWSAPAVCKSESKEKPNTELKHLDSGVEDELPFSESILSDNSEFVASLEDGPNEINPVSWFKEERPVRVDVSLDSDNDDDPTEDDIPINSPIRGYQSYRSEGSSASTSSGKLFWGFPKYQEIVSGDPYQRWPDITTPSQEEIMRRIAEKRQLVDPVSKQSGWQPQPPSYTSPVVTSSPEKHRPVRPAKSFSPEQHELEQAAKSSHEVHQLGTGVRSSQELQQLGPVAKPSDEKPPRLAASLSPEKRNYLPSDSSYYYSDGTGTVSMSSSSTVRSMRPRRYSLAMDPSASTLDYRTPSSDNSCDYLYHEARPALGVLSRVAYFHPANAWQYRYPYDTSESAMDSGTSRTDADLTSSLSVQSSKVAEAPSSAPDNLQEAAVSAKQFPRLSTLLYHEGRMSHPQYPGMGFYILPDAEAVAQVPETPSDSSPSGLREDRKLFIMDMSKFADNLASKFKELIASGKDDGNALLQLLSQCMEQCSETVVQMQSPPPPPDPTEKPASHDSAPPKISTTKGPTVTPVEPQKPVDQDFTPEQEADLDMFLAETIENASGALFRRMPRRDTLDMKPEYLSKAKQRRDSKVEEEEGDSGSSSSSGRKRRIRIHVPPEVQELQEEGEERVAGDEGELGKKTVMDEEDDFKHKVKQVDAFPMKVFNSEDLLKYQGKVKGAFPEQKRGFKKWEDGKKQATGIQDKEEFGDKRKSSKYKLEEGITMKIKPDSKQPPYDTRSCSTCSEHSSNTDKCASSYYFKDMAGSSASSLFDSQSATTFPLQHCCHQGQHGLPPTVMEVRELDKDGHLVVHTQDWSESAKDFATDWRWKNGLLANIIRVQTILPATSEKGPVVQLEYDPMQRRVRGSLGEHEIETVEVNKYDSDPPKVTKIESKPLTYSSPAFPDALDSVVLETSDSLQSPDQTRHNWRLLNKMYIFFDELQSVGYGSGPPLVIRIRKDFFLSDMFETLMKPSNIPLHYYRDLRIIFKDDPSNSPLEKKSKSSDDEEASTIQDDTQEAFYLLSQYIFTPYYKQLFDYPSEDTKCLHLNPASPAVLHWFEFAGIILALSFIHQKQLGVLLPKSFFKCLLNRPLLLEDIDEVDPKLHERLLRMKTRDLRTSDPSLFFCVKEKYGDVYYDADLFPGSSSIKLTEGNKYQYIEKVLKWKLAERYLPQFKWFIRGFVSVIDAKLLNMFSDHELQQLVAIEPREPSSMRLVRNKTW